ncbi:MAG: hypothetical protein ACRDD8_05985 [Bacteroidales bacterium]
MSTNNSIENSLRTILGRGNSSIQIIKGFIQKIHPENSELFGTVDVIAMDGSVYLVGVSISAMQSRRGVVSVPTINSDVTVLWKSHTSEAYIIAYSHTDTTTIKSNLKSIIGASGLENQTDSTDYDEVADTGYETYTQYTPEEIIRIAQYQTKASTITQRYDRFSSTVGNTTIDQSETNVSMSSGGSLVGVSEDTVSIAGESINIGDGASENAVLGTTLKVVLGSFIDAVASITVATAIGTQPILNMAQVLTLKNQLDAILSQTIKLK